MIAERFLLGPKHATQLRRNVKHFEKIRGNTKRVLELSRMTGAGQRHRCGDVTGELAERGFAMLKIKIVRGGESGAFVLRSRSDEPDK